MTKPVPRDLHLKQCIISDCELPIVICNCIMKDGKPCGQMGHPDYYKCSDDHVMLVVKHTHFLPLSMQDTGRNDFHKAKKIIAPGSIKVWTWKTDRTGDRWRRIPREVCENLGWVNET